MWQVRFKFKAAPKIFTKQLSRFPKISSFGFCFEGKWDDVFAFYFIMSHNLWRPAESAFKIVVDKLIMPRFKALENTVETLKIC